MKNKSTVRNLSEADVVSVCLRFLVNDSRQLSKILYYNSALLFKTLFAENKLIAFS